MKKESGFTLFMALVISSALLLGSYGIASALLNQLKTSSSLKESHKAYVAADSGIECATYYDNPVRNAFSTTTVYTGIVGCSGKLISNNDTLSPISGTAIIGGGGIVPESPSVGLSGHSATPSVFRVVYGDNSCSLIYVTKYQDSTGALSQTTLDSRGYNICDPTNPQRVERALKVTIN